MPDKPTQPRDIPLTGRLVTALDGLVVGENFTTLKNMRYVATHLRAIPGMSKINSTALTTFLKVRSGHHYTKTHPSTESHVLVQAENAGETASQVLENTTVIPNTGDFSATALHADDSAATLGRFADAPQGQVTYCNGAESLIWGGDESRCAGFINFDPTEAFSFDYTRQIQNLQTTADNVATIKPAESSIDADTMLLLHMDALPITDSSPTTPHTITNVNVTLDTANKVFGAGAALFNGTDAKLTVPDNDDFDFSGGTWTVDCRLRVTSLASLNPIFYQENVAGDYITIFVSLSGKIVLNIWEDAGAEIVVTVVSASNVISVDTFHHVAVVETGDTFLIFVDGVQVASKSDTDRATNYTSVISIGHELVSGTWFSGQIDEYRVSDSARWVGPFTPPATAYSVSATVGWMYVGSLLPLRGFKMYVETANTSAGAMAVDYWTGAGWSPVSTLVDGTSSGGVSLAITGEITFDDTKSTAAIREVESKLIYWYRVAVSVVDITTTLSHVSVDYSMQQIQDIWDGIFRPALSVQEENPEGQFTDVSVAVFDEDYTSANTASFYNMSSFLPTESLYMGFSERQTGLFFVLQTVNIVTSTMTVSYWDGDDWVAVSGLSDGTSEGGVTLAKSGTIVWNAPAIEDEFTKIIARGSPLYYYRITVNAEIHNDVKVDKIAGIPAQVDIPGYRFPMLAQDRVWLCGRNDRDRNSALCSARDTFSIFNGDDSLEIFFGDDTPLTAGTSLYSQYGSSLYDMMIFFKAHETWVVTGGGPVDWVKFPASKETGCVAPLTLVTANVTAQVVDGTNRHVAFLQASDGIYIFDGRIFTRISDDIENFFDPIASDTMNQSMVSKSVGFYDEVWREYHWLFATGNSTDLNREFVYTVKSAKWYEVDRGTKDLQFGLPVKDTSGNNYSYGFIDTGYMERLENGTTFDGDDMTFTFKFGDIMLGGSPNIEAQVDQVLLTTIAKTSTTNKINMTRYVDTVALTTTFEFDPAHTTKRVLHLSKDMDRTKKITNSFEFTITTNNEAIGFEPMVLSLQGKNIRLKKDG